MRAGGMCQQGVLPDPSCERTHCRGPEQVQQDPSGDEEGKGGGRWGQGGDSTDTEGELERDLGSKATDAEGRADKEERERGRDHGNATH